MKAKNMYRLAFQIPNKGLWKRTIFALDDLDAEVKAKRIYEIACLSLVNFIRVNRPESTQKEDIR